MEQDTYAYVVQLVLIHPHWGADQITAGLGYPPSRAWSVGEPAATGQRLQTMWYRTSRVVGSRFFFREVAGTIELLATKAGFIGEFQRTGGKCRLTVQLDGSRNIGDELDPATMRSLADIGVWIGVEVFPNFDPG